jgi:hypothetical protein
MAEYENDKKADVYNAQVGPAYAAPHAEDGSSSEEHVSPTGGLQRKLKGRHVS